MEINRNSLEGRILKILLEKYPITFSELREELLNVKETILKEEIKKLQFAGIVAVDILPDKIFLRLLREDFTFIGIKNPQKKSLIIKRRKRRFKFGEYNNEVMYR